MGIEFNSELNLQNLTGTQKQTGSKKLSKTGDIDVAAALKALGKSSKSDSAKAREKLDNIKASNGMTYKEAKAKMKEIEQKYLSMSGDDGWGGIFSHRKNKYLKEVQDPSPEVPGHPGMTYSVYRYHFEVDGNALPEPDKTEYRKAKAAVEEIERNNSALVSDAKSDFGFNISF
ncbi:hypothetical protein IJ541_05450 [bacterium]|nr:hypothetical protein [bacterium]